MTRLGQFSDKINPFLTFWAMKKNVTFQIKSAVSILGNFVVKIGLLFVTSSHTGSKSRLAWVCKKRKLQLGKINSAQKRFSEFAMN